MKHEYPDSKSDLFAAFIERAVSLLKRHGYMAQVTMQSWMFLSSYERLRSKLQRDAAIVAMLHMDNMVMRIAFGTCATIWKIGGNSRLPGKYTWMELDDLAGESPRRFPARNPRNTSAGSDGFFTVSQRDMNEIPGSPIVYWLSEKMRATFSEGRPLSKLVDLRVGLRTGDNDRFLRYWWEVSGKRSAFHCDSLEDAEASGARWFPYNKGGSFRRWFGNHEYVVNWEHDGHEIEHGLAERYPYLVPAGKTLVRGQGRDRYFSPSVSWSKVSSGVPAFRVYPPGFVYDVAGTSIFSSTSRDRYRLLAFVNSLVALEQLAALAPTLNFEVGQVACLPLVESGSECIEILAEGAVETSRLDWNMSETSWNFSGNALVSQARNS
ncbi:hypothetical protein PV375_00595 [Gulosibacter sp. GYB002]|uniref:Eco57I restriction-modification methylase domain-containing protein n=1 Tax=Gulosibacter sp. GYB002 TaxID=2994391 RepID=UPI002F965504